MIQYSSLHLAFVTSKQYTNYIYVKNSSMAWGRIALKSVNWKTIVEDKWEFILLNDEELPNI